MATNPWWWEEPPKKKRPKTRRGAGWLLLLGTAVGVWYVADHVTDSGREPSRETVSYFVPATPAPEPYGNLLESVWSDTTPKVNLKHIFHGEINRRGKAVGFHARPGGRDPDDAGVLKVIDGPNFLGVYVAKVAIGGRRYRWHRWHRWQQKRSTFFPDRYSVEDVVRIILEAWGSGQCVQVEPAWQDPQHFRCPTKRAFAIEGWTDALGRINTAYPVFEDL